MGNIKDRLSKLEQHAHDTTDIRTKVERDAACQAVVQQILPVAGLCNSSKKLAAHIKTLWSKDDGDVVSLEEKRRRDAIIGVMARTVFDKSRDGFYNIPPLAS